MDCSTDIILEEKKKGSLIQTFFGTHSLPRIHFFRIRRKQLGGPVLEHWASKQLIKKEEEINTTF